MNLSLPPITSGAMEGAQYERLWCAEPIGAEEVAFEASVFLLTKAKAQPLGLTATRLMQVSRLPLEWRAQRQALGFS